MSTPLYVEDPIVLPEISRNVDSVPFLASGSVLGMTWWMRNESVDPPPPPQDIQPSPSPFLSMEETSERFPVSQYSEHSMLMALESLRDYVAETYSTYLARTTSELEPRVGKLQTQNPVDSAPEKRSWKTWLHTDFGRTTSPDLPKDLPIPSPSPDAVEAGDYLVWFGEWRETRETMKSVPRITPSPRTRA